MIDRSEIRVVFHDDGWQVISPRSTRSFGTQAAAIKAAREEAWELMPSRLFIYTQKGDLREAYRYDETQRSRLRNRERLSD